MSTCGFEFDAVGGTLRILDQRQLPESEAWIDCRTVEAIAAAIEGLAVRGAPAIGCVAALGISVAVKDASDGDEVRALAFAARDRLRRTRPTAVNLFVALDQVIEALQSISPQAPLMAQKDAIRTAALQHVLHDAEACARIGEHGSKLLLPNAAVLTHCNTGALATAGIGTALGIVRTAFSSGQGIRVYATETRPLLQGARLTAWELARDGIEVTVITDSMVGALLATGQISAALVGADRICRNGDVVNKVGTYGLAVLCRHHRVPFYVAAPWTTIDLDLANGREVEIEERQEIEVRRMGDRCTVPTAARVWNPAFDMTPAALISLIVTERGFFAPDQLVRAE